MQPGRTRATFRGRGSDSVSAPFRVPPFCHRAPSGPLFHDFWNPGCLSVIINISFLSPRPIKHGRKGPVTQIANQTHHQPTPHGGFRARSHDPCGGAGMTFSVGHVCFQVHPRDGPPSSVTVSVRGPIAAASAVNRGLVSDDRYCNVFSFVSFQSKSQCK